jgi:release factor glutamine methyltransferase
MKYVFFASSIGIRCDSSNKTVIASINSKGQKRIRGEKVKNNYLLGKPPFIRGLLSFVYGLFVFFTSFDEIFIDDITLSEREQKAKIRNIILTSIFIAIGIILWIVILGYLPAQLSFLIIGYSSSTILRNFIIALIKIIFLYLLLTLLRFLPMMSELYKFNGAGNLTFFNIGKNSNDKKYLHIPLNFLNFVIFSLFFSIFMITFIGVNESFGIDLLVNLSIFCACVSFSYEFLNLLQKNEKFYKMVLPTSFLIVSKPSITHLELARSVFIELASTKDLRVSMKNNEYAMSLVKSEMETKLSKNGTYEESDIDWIIATVLDKNRVEIKLVRSVTEKEYRDIMKATEERAKGKPLSAIFGFVDFFGYRFSVNKKVLSPRMETELLVEEVIKEIKNFKKCKVLDVGTGSGAIAICVAKNSIADVTAVDISKSALEVAKQNAKDLNAKVNFVQSDLFSQLKKKQKYDIIVSNPPYIRSLDVEGLDIEVKNYDPRLALDGGEDGLDFYRNISEQAINHLNNGGKLLFEIGKGQFTQVKSILAKFGYSNIKGLKDYNKIYRIVKAEWKK